MQDPDVFLYLTARDVRNLTSSAFRLLYNKRWYHHNVKGGVAEQPCIASRENTPAVAFELLDDSTLSSGEHLAVTFSGLLDQTDHQALTLENGVVFGTNPTWCHVLLGHRGTAGISGKHFAIAVDADSRVWLRDCGSSYGTAVECDGQHRASTQKGTHSRPWILAHEPGSNDLYTDVVVHTGQLAVGVKLPNHAISDSRYLSNLARLSAAIADARTLRDDYPCAVSGLALNSNVTTAAPSEATTPFHKQIYYDKGIIGKGAFGEVRKVIQASTGEIFAAKRFAQKPKKRRRGEADPAWITSIRREYNIVKDHPHANVIEVFEFQESAEPTIIMAFYANGSIAEAENINEAAYISAYGQILCGLDHFHQHGIAHRDLKPENILVQQKPFFKVVIADFGLANLVTNEALLTTFCGTLEYAAPEIFPGSNGHNTFVDIWSLGVMVMKWIYEAPAIEDPPVHASRNKRNIAANWQNWVSRRSQRLLDTLGDQEDGPLTVMLAGMIEPRTTKRWAARRCLEYGFAKNLFRIRRADGLVVCRDDPHDVAVGQTGDDTGACPFDVFLPVSSSAKQQQEDLFSS